ncbi:MAG: hypothetical protein MH137_13600 [Flavobacteriales bacterium]|nr:hypothetical protein [Flavobacteriales bacterium]
MNIYKAAGPAMGIGMFLLFSCGKINKNDNLISESISVTNAYESNPNYHIPLFKEKLKTPDKSSEEFYSIKSAEWIVEAIINYDNPLNTDEYTDTLIHFSYVKHHENAMYFNTSELSALYLQTESEISIRKGNTSVVGFDLRLNKIGDSTEVKGLILGRTVPSGTSAESMLFDNSDWWPQQGKCNGQNPTVSTPTKLENAVKTQFPVFEGDYYTNLQTVYVNTWDIIDPNFNNDLRLYFGQNNACISNAEMVGFYNKSFNIINHFKPSQKVFKNWLVLFDYSGTGNVVLWFYHITYGNKHNINDPVQ